MGIGPIPWDSIDRYCSRFHIDDELEFNRFLKFIRTLDGVYIEFKKESKSGTEDDERNRS